MKIRALTWKEFDHAVRRIAAQAPPATGVYGVPRGGLCLAVALSHRLELPLVAAPTSATLIVDDVVDSGATRAGFSGHPPDLFWAWVDKHGSLAVNAALRLPADEWIVFPWETIDHAQKDAEGYYASR